MVEAGQTMKRDNLNYFVVGVFVLVATGVFFVFMYFVTGRTGPAEHYIVHYNNVSGLKFGTGVFYEGYRVGQIEKIVPEATPTGMRYVLTLSIAQGWKIPNDSVARIVSSGLISAVQIEIDEGSSLDSLDPGDEIRSEEQQNLFAVLGEVAGDLHDLSRDGMMPMLRNLNQRISDVADEIVSFRRNDLTPLVENLNQRLNEDLIGDAQALIAELDDSAQNLNKILGGANQRQIERFLVHIDEVAVDSRALISRIELTRMQMSKTLAALEHLVLDNDEGVSSAINNANASMQQMRDALTTVNSHLGTIMYNVEGSTRQLHEFAQAVRDNPARLIRGTNAHDDAQ